jgi:hypothetical protein
MLGVNVVAFGAPAVDEPGLQTSECSGRRASKAALICIHWSDARKLVGAEYEILMHEMVMAVECNLNSATVAVSKEICRKNMVLLPPENISVGDIFRTGSKGSQGFRSNGITG